MQTETFAAPHTATPAFALRPLTTGEVMDRSFSLFRASFLLCIAISMVPALLAVVQLAVRLIYLKLAHLSALTSAWGNPVLGALTAILSLLGLVVFGWSSAALSWAVSQRYLGRPATVREAYALVLRRWFRYPALLVLQLVQSAWLTIILYGAGFGLAAYATTHHSFVLRLYGVALLLLGGLSIFLSMFLYVRLSLAMPAAVMEDLAATAALRRSKDLLQTRKGRIFAVLVLVGVLYFVLGSAIGVLSLMFVRGHIGMLAVQGAGLLSNFIGTLLLQPLLLTALCVLYYDERVRRDGYDLTFLMEQTDRDLATQAIPAFPVASPSSDSMWP